MEMSPEARRYMRKMRRKGRRFLRKSKKRMFWPIYAVLLFLLLWGLFLPDSFSGFIWRYFWGPVVADVQGHPVDGIHEGYNPVNTLAYAGILVAVLFYGKGWLLKKKRVWFDMALLMGLLPLVLTGPVSRVLEDASAFPLPAAYLFVSPFIYIWIGGLALFFMLFAAFLERREDYEAFVLCAIPYPFALKFLWYVMPGTMYGFDLLFFMGLSLVFAALHMWHVRKHGYEMASSVFLYSSYVLSVFVYFSFLTFSDMPNPEILIAVPSIAFVSVLITWFLTRYSLLPAYFGDRMNLALVLAMSLDGAATWLGIDLYGYGEKHVLGGLITENMGGMAFFFLKFGLSLVVIGLLDSVFKEDLKDGNLRNLIRFVIFFLTSGPGIRDMLRVALGV